MTLAPYRHPTLGFTIPLPTAWERLENTAGAAVIAVEPAHDGWFRANVVVTAEKLPGDMGLPAWSDAAATLLPESLVRYWPIHAADVTLAGRPARHTVGHHTVEEKFAVTMTQWALVAGGLGYTVTGSVGTLDHDQFADPLALMAAGFRPADGEAAR